ncbi:hypothetical protein AST03_13395 [Staphylococcus equorum]|uniref:BppU family phage baseplate upper protein n=1 Tax=Staphylococcus equorum TaxID=246432 RepID=UPI0008529BE0|nr:BppU family phage baseplate upper protein [Staphylococcus equorum]OEK72256.1 hypothetical protein AST03_13395 [Staphylococcus equorum]
MSIDKKALFNLSSEPYLKPISNLGVGFYNLDENTAVLQFQLSNSKGPLLIHENNLTAYAYFESDNGSASDVVELEIKDSNNGIVEITLDTAFLQASTSTTVKGQVYMAVNNHDGDPAYNEVAVFREFTFEVADALINKISAFTKVENIRMFNQLKIHIEQRVSDIDAAIANGEDYVAQMKATLLNGKSQLNQIVTDGTATIDGSVTQAKADITAKIDLATAEITTLSNNTKTDVQNTADNAITEITDTSNTATTHLDTKVAEFNQTVLDNGFVTPEQLTTDLDALTWQKYKMTNDDGTFLDVNLDNDLAALQALAPGYYYTTNTPGIVGSSTAGYTHVEYRDSLVKRITFRPYNSTQEFIMIYYNEWSSWERVDNDQNDTGWVSYTLINGAVEGGAYTSLEDNGFTCAYRTIESGGVKRKQIRFNVKKLTQTMNFAQLPAKFVEHTQVAPVRTPRNRHGAIVEIKADGKLFFTHYGDTWIDTDYIYGQYEWTE